MLLYDCRSHISGEILVGLYDWRSQNHCDWIFHFCDDCCWNMWEILLILVYRICWWSNPSFQHLRFFCWKKLNMIDNKKVKEFLCREEWFYNGSKCDQVIFKWIQDLRTGSLGWKCHCFYLGASPKSCERHHQCCRSNNVQKCEELLLRSLSRMDGAIIWDSFHQ